MIIAARNNSKPDIIGTSDPYQVHIQIFHGDASARLLVGANITPQMKTCMKFLEDGNTLALCSASAENKAGPRACIAVGESV